MVKRYDYVHTASFIHVLGSEKCRKEARLTMRRQTSRFLNIINPSRDRLYGAISLNSPIEPLQIILTNSGFMEKKTIPDWSPLPIEVIDQPRVVAGPSHQMLSHQKFSYIYFLIFIYFISGDGLLPSQILNIDVTSYCVQQKLAMSDCIPNSNDFPSDILF